MLCLNCGARMFCVETRPAIRMGDVKISDPKWYLTHRRYNCPVCKSVRKTLELSAATVVANIGQVRVLHGQSTKEIAEYTSQ
jgi:hypothetical protein